MPNISLDKTITEVKLDIEKHLAQIRRLRNIIEGHAKCIHGLQDYLKGLEGFETLRMIGIRADCQKINNGSSQ